jgi:hypothetical protein
MKIKYPNIEKILVEASPEISRSDDGIAIKLIAEDGVKKSQHPGGKRLKATKTGEWISIDIETGRIFAGSKKLSPKDIKRIQDFISRNKKDLLTLYDRAVNGESINEKIPFEKLKIVGSSEPYLVEIYGTDDFQLIATYSNGTTIQYDFQRIFKNLKGDAAQALKDINLFKTVTVETGDAHWSNDFDLSGASIYLNGKQIQTKDLVG